MKLCQKGGGREEGKKGGMGGGGSEKGNVGEATWGWAETQAARKPSPEKGAQREKGRGMKMRASKFMRKAGCAGGHTLSEGAEIKRGDTHTGAAAAASEIEPTERFDLGN